MSSQWPSPEGNESITKAIVCNTACSCCARHTLFCCFTLFGCELHFHISLATRSRHSVWNLADGKQVDEVLTLPPKQTKCFSRPQSDEQPSPSCEFPSSPDERRRHHKLQQTIGSSHSSVDPTNPFPHSSHIEVDATEPPAQWKPDSTRQSEPHPSAGLQQQHCSSANMRAVTVTSSFHHHTARRLIEAHHHTRRTPS